MNSELAWKLVVDATTIALSVYAGYLSTMRRLETRMSHLETQVAIVLDRDRRERLTDYKREAQQRHGKHHEGES